MAEEFYTGFGDQKILAERANKDINGNSLELTISGNTVTAIGGKSVGGGGSEPVDAYTKAECDSQFMANKKLTGTTTIAGREYKTVTIGNQVWMAENLDMKFDGLTVGSTEPPSHEELRANYYNNDEETYGAEGNKYGLLYNYPAVKYINDNRSTLIPGWHVPTEEELFALFRYIGETFDVGNPTTTVDTAGLKLKSSSGWDQQDSGETGNGIDTFGMSVIPSGLHTGTFTDIGRVGNLWTITTKPDIMYQAQSVHFALDQHAVIYPWYYGNEVGVRLVKDSDNADDLWRKYDDKEFDAKHSDVAERAVSDENGNNIVTTYATKAEVAEKMPTPNFKYYALKVKQSYLSYISHDSDGYAIGVNNQKSFYFVYDMNTGFIKLNGYFQVSSELTLPTSWTNIFETEVTGIGNMSEHRAMMFNKELSDGFYGVNITASSDVVSVAFSKSLRRYNIDALDLLLIR